MATITGKLILTDRFDTSRNGNPRYHCVIQNADYATSFYTGVDSMHGYGITNYLNKEVTVNLEWKRNKLTLTNIEGA